MFEEYIKKSSGESLFKDKIQPIAYVINDDIYNTIHQYGMMAMLNCLYKSKAIDRDVVESFLKYEDDIIKTAVLHILNDDF